jgi:predicted small lipoprotein YifL
VSARRCVARWLRVEATSTSGTPVALDVGPLGKGASRSRLPNSPFSILHFADGVHGTAHNERTLLRSRPRLAATSEKIMTRFCHGSLIAIACALSLSLAACEKKGPLEQAGEEVDEAIDTMKRGEESMSNKIDDAVDELRE